MTYRELESSAKLLELGTGYRNSRKGRPIEDDYSEGSWGWGLAKGENEEPPSQKSINTEDYLDR